MTLRLRPAVPDDEQFFFDLRTDPEVAQQSTAPPPSRAEHAAWYQRDTQDKRLLYVIEDTAPSPAELDLWYRAGMIRLDLTRDATAWVSLALCPRARGWGYGRQVLALVEPEACARGVRTLHAWVKATNPASLRTFDAAGYTFVGMTAVKFAMKDLT